MEVRALQELRAFLAASFLGGGILLLAFARILQAPVDAQVAVLAVAWPASLAAVALHPRTHRALPASALLLSLLLGVGWAHVDPNGHLVLSALGPAAAILAGLGILLRREWAWPVAIVLASGIGPLFLAFAPLPLDAYVGAMVLFAADVVALLAIRDDGSAVPGARGP
jgi:hypothetical protein